MAVIEHKGTTYLSRHVISVGPIGGTPARKAVKRTKKRKASPAVEGSYGFEVVMINKTLSYEFVSDAAALDMRNQVLRRCR